MKQNKKITLAIGLGVVILLNIVILGWLLTDFFSGPNGPEETVSTIDSGEVTTEAITTMPEETSTEETTEEPTTEEITTEDLSTEAPVVEWTEKKISLEEAKRIIYTFSWGTGEDQLGYDSDVHESKSPRGFSVEGDQICVWDDANRRILIYENGRYSAIETGYFRGKTGMKYQNGWIGLLNEDDKKVELYRSDRSMEMSFKLPYLITGVGTPKKIIEIGDTYIILEVKFDTSKTTGRYYYDWTTDRVERITDDNLPAFFEEQDEVEVIGVYDDVVYYEDMEIRENVAIPIVGLKAKNYHLYVELDQTNYIKGATVPRYWTYLSTDGRLYIMECFEGRVEISELTLE